MLARYWLTISKLLQNNGRTKDLTEHIANLVKGELNPKIDFSSFGHLGIVEQLYEVFLSC